MLQELSRGITGSDEVIHLTRGGSDPARAVFSQFHPSQGGVVPKKAITAIGDEEGDTHLGVELQQIYDAAFLVQPAVQVLTQPVEFFTLVGLKSDREVPGGAARVRAKPARRRMHRVR